MFSLQGHFAEKHKFQFRVLVISACGNKANYFFHSNVISCNFNFYMMIFQWLLRHKTVLSTLGSGFGTIICVQLISPYKKTKNRFIVIKKLYMKKKYLPIILEMLTNPSTCGFNDLRWQNLTGKCTWSRGVVATFSHVRTCSQNRDSVTLSGKSCREGVQPSWWNAGARVGRVCRGTAPQRWHCQVTPKCILREPLLLPEPCTTHLPLSHGSKQCPTGHRAAAQRQQTSLLK